MNEVVTNLEWHDANQQYLMAALRVVCAALKRAGTGVESRGDTLDAARQALSAAAQRMPSPPALELLTQAFGLSPFERDLLVLCAGMELDSSVATDCATAHGDPARTQPTFSLALSALEAPHWSALSPVGPLRHWRLIELGAGTSVTRCPLRIDETVLHFLTGTGHLDERLASLVELTRSDCVLVESHAALVERIARAWPADDRRSLPPVIHLVGGDPQDQRAVAVSACRALDLHLYTLSAHDIPQGHQERDLLIRLWSREATLNGTALLVDCNDVDTVDVPRWSTVSRLIEHVVGPILVSSRDRRPAMDRNRIFLDVLKPSASEQRAIWQRTLGLACDALNGHVDRLVQQFSLSHGKIQSAWFELQSCSGTVTAHRLWDACRAQARVALDQMAQRIEPAATWDDLVLPAAQRRMLNEVATHVKHRATVYERWGFRAAGARGLGITALFAGSSGTGKTMAAEVLAGELRLDLYRVDLSAVVSKYIGETEKNLCRVFDAAEEGSAILLFDEADALFGKRSEVKDSHDRYANVEVSYLLQRMEAYRGLAILTTNLKSNLDTAFLRRIRFVVQFPFPDANQRAEIWQRVFPANTPTDGLDATVLSRLNVAGGHIRNIALNAAFLAADAGEPVRMSHLLLAARGEYAKLEKPLTESEIGGWK